MSRESKKLKKSSSDWQCNNTAIEKCNFRVPVLPGNAEAQVT